MPCYLLTCNKCFKQYVDQTVDKFRRRWNNYKSNDRRFQRFKTCMQEHLFSYFSMADHDGFLKMCLQHSLKRLIHLILYREKITGNKHLKQLFRTDLILKTVSDGCFCVYFLTWKHQIFLHGYVGMF